MIKWTHAIFLWLLVPANRRAGIMYTRKALDIIAIATKLTSNKKDDEVIKNIRKTMEDLLKALPFFLALRTIEDINITDSGPLKTVSIGYDEKSGLKAGIDIKF